MVSSLFLVETPLPRVTWWSPGNTGIHSRWICLLLYLPFPSSSAAHTSGHAFLCFGATFPALLPRFWTAHTPHSSTMCATDSPNTALQSISALRPVVVQSDISSSTWTVWNGSLTWDHHRAHTDRPGATHTVHTRDWSSIMPSRWALDGWTLFGYIPGISHLSVWKQSGPVVSRLSNHRPPSHL